MRRVALAGACAALAAVFGCKSDGGGDDGQMASDSGESGGGSSDGPADCTIPEYEDVLALQTDGATALSGAPQRMATAGDSAMVCGVGFAAATTVGGNPAVVADAALDGPCGGIASAGSDRAVVATRAGQLALVEFGASPRVVAALPGTDTYYDVLVDGDQVWVAAGTAGVLGFTLDADTLTAGAGAPGAVDARGLATVGGALLVADGHVIGEIDDPTAGGAEVRLVDAAGGGMIGEVTGLIGTASRPYVAGDRAVVLRPGFGFDVFDVSAASLTLAYSVQADENLNEAVFDGETLVAAAGTRVLKFAIGDTEATLDAVENRPGRGELMQPWFRTIAQVGPDLVVGTDTQLVPLSTSETGVAPQVSAEASALSMAAGQTEALFKFTNSGTAPLLVSGIAVDAPFTAEIDTQLSDEKPGCPGQFELEPGKGMLFFLRHDGSADHATASIVLSSNDPDEPEFSVRAEINRPQAQVGDTPEDFSLLTVDGTAFSLSGHRGDIVLAKLYNPL